jgi:hypothetical protein
MNLPPIPDDWRTDWHLAAHMNDFAGGGAIDVTVAGTVIRARLSGHGRGRRGVRADER